MRLQTTTLDSIKTKMSVSKYLFKGVFLFHVFKIFARMHVCAAHACLLPVTSEEEVRSVGIGAIDYCEPHLGAGN